MVFIYHKIKWAVLLGGDITMLYLSLWLTLKVRYGADLTSKISQQHFTSFSFAYGIWLIVFYILGLYDLMFAKNNLTFYYTLLKSLVVCGILTLAFFYFIPTFGIAPKTNLLLNLLFFFLLFSIWRQVYNSFVASYPLLSRKIIIVGTNLQVTELIKKIRTNPQLGYQVIANIRPDVNQLKKLPHNHDVHTIVNAINLHQYPEFTRNLYHHLALFDFENFPAFYEIVTGKVPISQIDETWFLSNFRETRRRLYEIAKRLSDILIGFVLAAFTIVMFPFVALAIKLDSKGPVFYRQLRMGKDGKIFWLIKFRSMVQNAENGKATWAQKNDSRITRIGKILRKTLIDELPQCFNILKGDMSVIGPRPERPEFVKELEAQIPFYQIRHIVKPGLTGWAQISFPYGNSIEGALEKLQYELYYIKNRSSLLDLKIVLKTINIALKGGTL